jgi:hypothetical protein
VQNISHFLDSLAQLHLILSPTALLLDFCFSQRLMKNLKKTKPYFVRCIKPNLEKKPGMFKDPYVGSQLRCGGLIEAIRIIKVAAWQHFHPSVPVACLASDIELVADLVCTFCVLPFRFSVRVPHTC